MFEEHIEPMVRTLRQLRYSKAMVQRTSMAAREFCLYLADRVERPGEVTSDHLRGYLDARARQFGHFRQRTMTVLYRKAVKTSVHLFLRYLADQGVRTRIPLRQPKDLRAVPGHEETLTRFEQFLRQHRGLVDTTTSEYLDHAARLCRTASEEGLAHWDDMMPRLLYDHLRRQARTQCPNALRTTQTALRNFFRFLRFSGICQKDLTAYLVRYQTYRLQRVPKTVSPKDLDRLFEDLQGNSMRDVRDRAVFLLLTLYGLRVGEVARLTMDDVDWREQRIVVRQRKVGRDLVLPLLPVIAKALWEYVERVRPRGTPYREVFIARYRPHPYPKGGNLAMTLRGRLRKLGLPISPHAFRHALASRLINNDCPPEWIQQLLGHGRFESTQIYAKVDMAHLREVTANDVVDS